MKNNEKAQMTNGKSTACGIVFNFSLDRSFYFPFVIGYFSAVHLLHFVLVAPRIK